MKNNSYQDITKAESMAKKYKYIMLFTIAFLALTFVIGGICICALVDASTGAPMIFSGIIMGALGIFGAYYSYQMTIVLLDVATDVKTNRIMNEGRAISNAPQQPQVLQAIAQCAYETSDMYYLMSLESAEYLYADLSNSQVLRTTSSLLEAMNFQSEEEALKFADYKGLRIDEKWKVVRKKLIIPIE